MGEPVLKIRRNAVLKTLSLSTLALGLSTAIGLAQQIPDNNAQTPLADYLKRLSEAQVTPAATTQAPRAITRNTQAEVPEPPVQPQRRYQEATARDAGNRFDAVRESTFAVPQERQDLPRYGIQQNVQVPAPDLGPLANINNQIAAPIAPQNGITPPVPADTNIDPTQTGRIQQNAPAANQDPNRLRRVLRSRRAQPAQAFETRTLTRDATPYAATGINMGIWTIRPSVTTGLEVTTGDEATTTTSNTSFDLDADANLADGTLTFDGQLNLSKVLQDDRDLEITGNANLSGSKKLSNSLQALAGLNFQRSRASATGDLTTLNTTSTETDLNTFSANFGLQNQNAKTQFSTNIEISRDIYDDLTAAGTFIDQSDRNNTSITGTLRLGYEATPSISPFAQLVATRRIMDNERDANGLEQSGYTFDASLGATFDLGEKLNGEASIGWLRTTYDDDRLESSDALALNALVNWSPRRNTDIAFDLATTTNSGAGTTTGTSVSYATGLTVTQQLRENFALTGRIGHTYLVNNSAANESQINLRVGADYQFNRTFGITGNIEHQMTQTDGAEDQNATTFRLGLTARR